MKNYLVSFLVGFFIMFCIITIYITNKNIKEEKNNMIIQQRMNHEIKLAKVI